MKLKLRAVLKKTSLSERLLEEPYARMETQPSFVEEIDYRELSFIEVVGKGAFGVVSRAKWRGKDVAVKRIETESEKKAFMQELKQLSRVNHPNIVQLYGACREHPVCLVMEYAEGGSLYNVLHGSGQQPNYTMAHAMSWCLQCAKGVEYLHNMKPKALVHRDLKPPNLLLILGGTVLKICDFGTACDKQTHMTNNKGSAAWMAPEVFEGSNYSEKCDVFSWGIIFWEVLTRRKPFDEIGGPAFRIMWAVHNGRRPPAIQNLPKPLELLMTRCWSGTPSERPSMTEVARVMNHMCQFFPGGDAPLVITRGANEEEEDDDYMDSRASFSVTPQSPVMHHTGGMTGGSQISTISDTLRYYQDGRPPPAPLVVEEESRKPRGQMSAPPSLAASRESLHDPRGSRSATPVDMGKRFSADLTKLDELDLSGHHPPLPPQREPLKQSQPLYVEVEDEVMGHRRIGSDEYNRISSGSSPLLINTSSGQQPKNPPFHHSSTYPSQLTQLGMQQQNMQGNRNQGDGQTMSPPSRSFSYQPPGHDPISISPRSISLSSDPNLSMLTTSGNDAAYANVNNNSNSYFTLEPNLQPILPSPNCEDSMLIFEEHRLLADKYLRIQAEIAVLTQRKHELLREQDERTMGTGQRTYNVEYTKLVSENESLMKVHKDLKSQVEKYRKSKRIG